MLQRSSLCHVSHVGVTSVCPAYLQLDRFVVYQKKEKTLISRACVSLCFNAPLVGGRGTM